MAPQRTKILRKRLIGMALLVRRAFRLLRSDGIAAFAREAILSAGGRVLYGIPVTSAGNLIGLNRDYDRWIRTNGRQTDPETIRQRLATLAHRPLISVLMPVYDVDPAHLSAAIASVLEQEYERWELLIVNDASPRSELRAVLDAYAAGDRRILITHLENNVGIARASQVALERASGEFVALLDHDDELTPDALFHVASAVGVDPDVDLIYSDEDKRSPSGRLVDPFFKPAWSPDMLRSMNYITHLSVFRTDLVRRVGGFRTGFDGSQDYDLLLRVTHSSEHVAHIPRVLYHYRQTIGSAALNPDAKPYAFDAGVRALEEALVRSGERGSVERLNPAYYRVKYDLPVMPSIGVVALGASSDHDDTAFGDIPTVLAPTLPEALERIDTEVTYLVICDARVRPIGHSWLEGLLEHAQRLDVGAVGPLIVRDDGRVAAAGMLLGGPTPEPAFEGWPQRGWGPYYGLLRSTQNPVALAGCLMIRRSVLDSISPSTVGGGSPSAEIELSVRLRAAGLRLVSTPYAKVRLSGGIRRQATRKPVADPVRNPNITFADGHVRMVDGPKRS